MFNDTDSCQLGFRKDEFQSIGKIRAALSKIDELYVLWSYFSSRCPDHSNWTNSNLLYVQISVG